MNKIIQGDCLDKLKELEDNSIDSIVTDPPYELGFMGKSWDSTGIANNVDMWKECLRVLKPGGHLLAFSGTRTYHRMASAIEDAGFEVRDMIEWVYGSGFPKSLNIGKAVDKLQGNERKIVGEKRTPDGKTWSERRPNGDITGYVGNGENKKENTQGIETKGTSEWEGWGTALKPAHEPICMARKPLSEKTVAENCLKWGTGGINIDESRVGTEQTITRGRSSGGTYDIGLNNPEFTQTNTGRFPANLIHDNSEEVRECFPSPHGAGHKREKFIGNTGSKNINIGGGITANRFGDSGNASRFFKSIIYQAKASKSERNRGCEGLEEKTSPNNLCSGSVQKSGEGTRLDGKPLAKNTNNHPTVKPIALMEYLIKMVTKPGGVVLDPFAGSGSTLVAAKQNGFQYIGIEMTEEYIPIIEARLSVNKD